MIVYTNVFRDQLDRYGEVTHTLSKLRVGAQNSPNAVLCLNADDSLITSLHDDVPNPVIFYGVSTPLYEEQVSDLSDAPYCIKCKSEYQYDFVTSAIWAATAARAAAMPVRSRISASARSF